MENKEEFILRDFLPYILNLLAQSVSRDFSNIYKKHFKINVVEWRILAHLSQKQNISIRDLHEYVAVDKSKITRNIQKLCKRGMVNSQVSQHDRRLIEVSLTEQGHELLKQMIPIAIDYDVSLRSCLQEHEQIMLKNILNTLLTHLKKV